MKTSTNQAFIPFDRDRRFRIVTDDSALCPKSVTFVRNLRSPSSGIAGHVRPENAVTLVRNTQSSGASTKLEFSEQDIAAITERRVLARVVEDFLVAAVELCSADFLWHVPVLDLVGRSPGVTRYPGNGLDP